jgi:hypothetical protein
MADMPSHTSPPYSEATREDAIFHYTTAAGLIGILRSGELWSTAYYCANDESELATGKGVLSPLFWTATHELIRANDPLVETFRSRGVDIREYAKGFEQTITSSSLSSLCAYITCFCKPSSHEDFTHGLLSQWRGYGPDGGYALQFSKKKLLAEIEKANATGGFIYKLQDVHYTPDNKLKDRVLAHEDAFVQSYKEHLDAVSKLDLNSKTMSSPIASLLHGPLEALLEYLIHTKNQHFSEENECRLSVIDLFRRMHEVLPTGFYNRDGLIVPYKRTLAASFDVLKCVDWIIVGPSPRMTARFRSVTHLIKQLDLRIKVRPSHIPFTRT